MYNDCIFVCFDIYIIQITLIVCFLWSFGTKNKERECERKESIKYKRFVPKMEKYYVLVGIKEMIVKKYAVKYRYY